MAVSADEATAALRDKLGQPFSTSVFVANEEPGTELWWVSILDGAGWPLPGAGYLVGPDGGVWTLSSNSAIHDPAVAVRLLNAAYTSGLQDLLSADAFATRVKAVTHAETETVRSFLADLRGGNLRERSVRRLP